MSAVTATAGGNLEGQSAGRRAATLITESDKRVVVAVTMGTSSRDISPNGTHEPTQQLAIISLFATRYKVGPLALGKSDWSRLCCLVVRSSSSSQLFNSQRSRLSPSLVVPTQRLDMKT